MKPTEAAIQAAVKWHDENLDYRMSHFAISDLVCAAFAAVPDPTMLADKWDGWELADSDYADAVKDCTSWLRAFMRGES